MYFILMKRLVHSNSWVELSLKLLSVVFYLVSIKYWTLVDSVLCVTQNYKETSWTRENTYVFQCFFPFFESNSNLIHNTYLFWHNIIVGIPHLIVIESLCKTLLIRTKKSSENVFWNRCVKHFPLDEKALLKICFKTHV